MNCSAEAAGLTETCCVFRKLACLPLNHENLDTKSIHVSLGVDCCQVSVLCVPSKCQQTVTGNYTV